MNENVEKKSAGTAIGIGLILLLLGVIIGVGTTTYVHRTAKARPADQTVQASPTVAAPKASTQSQTAEWNPFEEMQQMQARMDRMFQESFGRLQASPEMDVFQNPAGYSLSLKVRDLKDHYEVRALLPDTKAADANVTLKGNELEVSVTDKQANQSSSKSGQVASSEWGRYVETLQLAGNLDRDGMKVEHKEHELLITIPKV